MLNGGINISELELSVRAYNSLRRAGIDSVSQLLDRWPDIKNIRNLGQRAYNEIGDKLLEYDCIAVYEPWTNEKKEDKMDYKKIIEGQIKLLVEVNEKLTEFIPDFADEIRENADLITTLIFAIEGLKEEAPGKEG